MCTESRSAARLQSQLNGHGDHIRPSKKGTAMGIVSGLIKASLLRKVLDRVLGGRRRV